MAKKKEYRPRPELIKNFAKVRRYLEQFAIYGINDSKDFQKTSIYKKRIKKKGQEEGYEPIRERYFQILWWQTGKWLEKGTFAIPNDEDIVKKNKGRRMIYADSRKFSNNPLYNIFRMKSFTDNDLLLHFAILMFFSQKPNKSQLSGNIYNIVGFFTKDYTTLNHKLREYVELGLIKKPGNGKYIIDKTPDFSSWENALFFYSEIFPLGIIGYYINSYHLLNKDSPFFYKHHYLFPALASQILYVLVNAINCRHEVILTICKNYMKKGMPEEEKINALPIKFYIGTRSGREYLLYRDCKDGEFKFVRLDHIDNVEIKDDITNYDEYKAKAADFEKYAWGVSNGKEQKKYNFQMELQINNDEKYVLRRLKRERRNGQVKQTGKNTYLYSVDAYDCGEMVPWVLTFICRIKKITCTQPEVVSKINSYIKESCKKYEVFGNEQK